jgi:hypothetical protein
MESWDLHAGVLLLYLRPTSKYPQRAISITAPRLVEVGARVFVSGKVLRPRRWWDSGLDAFVPLNEIELLYRFDTEEGYRRVMKGRWRWGRIRRFLRRA